MTKQIGIYIKAFKTIRALWYLCLLSICIIFLFSTVSVVVKANTQMDTPDSQMDTLGGYEDTPGCWILTDGKWQWQFTDGTRAMSVIIQYHGDCYGLDFKGDMLTGWVFNEYHWYYFEPIRGCMHTGWLYKDAQWYWFDPNGVMATGWVAINGIWYYFDMSGRLLTDTVINGYYVDNRGAWVCDSDAWGCDRGTRDREYYVMNSLLQLKAVYEEGLYWNNMDSAVQLTKHFKYMGDENTQDLSTVNLYDIPAALTQFISNTPCNHSVYGMRYCNCYVQEGVRGFQCDGFARQLSDIVFGCMTPINEYSYEFDSIRIGDYIRYSYDENAYLTHGHSSIVIGKMDNSLLLVEVNKEGTCCITWGSEITDAQLSELYVRCYTRY